MPTLLSLFDESGNVSRPYLEAGWDVVQIDLAFGDDVRDFSCEYLLENVLEDYGTVDHVIAQPPCTDFTASGARWWDEKDSDGRTEASRELVYQALRTVEFLKPDVWWLENPAGRIERLCPDIGDRKACIHPHHYARYLDISLEDRRRLEQLVELDRQGRWHEMTRQDIDLTRTANAYKKATCLWGNFRLPPRKALEPVNVSRFGSWITKLGGASARTKQARSETPLGFAYAMFEANKDYRLDWDAIDEGREDYPMPTSTRFSECPAFPQAEPAPLQLQLAI